MATRLQSPDGRIIRTITSKDELDEFKDAGYVPVKKSTENGEREPLNTGSEGQRRARASSTTEGSEKNSGSTTPDK